MYRSPCPTQADRRFLFDIRESLLKKLIRLQDVRDKVLERAAAKGVHVAEEEPIYHNVIVAPYDIADLALYGRSLKTYNFRMMRAIQNTKPAPPSFVIASILSMASSITASFETDSSGTNDVEKEQVTSTAEAFGLSTSEDSSRQGNPERDSSDAETSPPTEPSFVPEIRLVTFTGRLFSDALRCFAGSTASPP